ncbi:MAG: SURF1 family cytochrome oxidase biogenesis protein [Erythrobacter sp.]|jgi:surfeit locus 1 family protein|nr:SURF1 family cytochrome oxidase biogenesis protein [Erythrobacter sp.]
MSIKVPILPTIIVAAAVLTMIALGIWQIGRADEKAALIARYSQATGTPDPVAFPLEGDGEAVWFRRSSVVCEEVLAIQPVAGTAANGAKGWAMRAQCRAGEGTQALIDLGFSRGLELPAWQGGEVTGIIAPGPRLIADPAIADLQPLAKPDPNDLPNNHIAYAGQWFFFALTALVIYVLALRARGSKKG